MPSFELLVFGGLFALTAAAGLAFLMVLRASRNAPAVAAFERGRFAEALELARLAGDDEPESLLAGARAARHLLDFDGAAALLARLIRQDAESGETWVEKGLTAAYCRDLAGAQGCFQKAAALRTDLLESITLHRAWAESAWGDPRAARRLFDEVEQSIVTKLDTELGGGDPAFAEWHLHAGWLWRAAGAEARAGDAITAARQAAPESRLPDLLDSWRHDPMARAADSGGPLASRMPSP